VTIPGFCLAKGIQPVLPIFRESILNGQPDIKEQAAKGLSEVISVSNADALKPSVVHITGPLIRILGDRFASNVKTAVLDTLASLLKKASVLLKPFFPQLQTTFMKALNDGNRTVRLMAGSALGYLIAIHMRPDPLFNELANGIKTSSDDSSVRDTYLQALRLCLERAGDKMSPPIRRTILPQLSQLTSHPDDVTRSTAGGCLGAFVKSLPQEDADAVVNDCLSLSDGDDWSLRHGRSTALFVALKDSPDRVYTDANQAKTVKVILALLKDDRVPNVQNGIRCCAFLLSHLMKSDATLPADLLAPFARTINHSSNDVKQLLATVATFLTKELGPSGSLPEELMKPLLPMLVNGTKEKNSAVRSSCEGALVNILKMREDPDGKFAVECLQKLDSGAKDALQDTMNKVLQRVAKQPEGKEEDVDNTFLK